MNKTANILPVALALLLVAGIVSAAPLVYLDPASIDICEGEFTIDVVANDEVLGLTGFDLLIDFDEALMSYVGATWGPLLEDYPGEFFFYATDEGTMSNALLINGAFMGGSADGPGVLATITFVCDAEGASPIEFAMVDFRDIDNAPIPMTHEDGSVTIDDDTVVYIDPVWYSHPIDTNFFVDVVLGSGIHDVDFINLTVTYDSALLELQNVTKGALVPGSATLIWSGGAGSIDVELDISGSSISGVAAVDIEFKGIYGGTSPITIDSVALDTDTGTLVFPCVEHGSVYIQPAVPVEQLRWGMIKSLYR